MESLYNKTALKKMKKDELVEAYLKLQGVHHEELQSKDDLLFQMADNCDEYERETEARDEEIKELKEKNKKLEEEEELTGTLCDKTYGELMKLKEEIKGYEFESNESLVKAQKLYGQAFAIQAERDGLREQNDKLKEENKQLRYEVISSTIGEVRDARDKAKLLNKKLTVEVEEQASLVEKLDSRISDARYENKNLRREIDVLETALKVVQEENEINKKNILTYGLGKSE